MSEAEPPSHPEIREAVRRLCADFPGEYWQRLDRDRIYPAEFVRTLTEAGFLSILIPEQYGGAGLGLRAAAAVPAGIPRSGWHGRSVHAPKFKIGPIPKHRSEAEKQTLHPVHPRGETPPPG